MPFAGEPPSLRLAQPSAHIDSVYYLLPNCFQNNKPALDQIKESFLLLVCIYIYIYFIIFFTRLD